MSLDKTPKGRLVSIKLGRDLIAIKDMKDAGLKVDWLESHLSGLRKYGEYCALRTQCAVASKDEARLEAQISELEAQLEQLRASLSALK